VNKRGRSSTNTINYQSEFSTVQNDRAKWSYTDLGNMMCVLLTTWRWSCRISNYDILH